MQVIRELASGGADAARRHARDAVRAGRRVAGLGDRRRPDRRGRPAGAGRRRAEDGRSRASCSVGAGSDSARRTGGPLHRRCRGRAWCHRAWWSGGARTRGARRGMAKRRGAGRRARRTTIGALRGRLRVRAGHNLPILVTVAAAGPLRFAGAAARTALTSYRSRVIGARAHCPRKIVRSGRPVTRSPTRRPGRARRARGPAYVRASPSCSRWARARVAAPVTRESRKPRAVTSRTLAEARGVRPDQASRRPSVHLRPIDQETA